MLFLPNGRRPVLPLTTTLGELISAILEYEPRALAVGTSRLSEGFISIAGLRLFDPRTPASGPFGSREALWPLYAGPMLELDVWIEPGDTDDPDDVKEPEEHKLRYFVEWISRFLPPGDPVSTALLTYLNHRSQFDSPLLYVRLPLVLPRTRLPATRRLS